MRFSILFSLLLASFTNANSIWHVTGVQEYYLFGTIHVLKPEAYPLPEAYTDAFSKCDVLWLEADLDEMTKPEIAKQLKDLMSLPSGQTLKNTISVEAYLEIEKLSEKAGFPLALIQNYKAWAVVNILTIAIFQKNGFDVASGLDEHLEEWALKKTIPVKYFEQGIWQIEMFDRLAQEYSDDFIEFSVNDIDQVELLVLQMYSDWKAGDIVSLYKQADFTDYPQIEKSMLSDRNATWMKSLLIPSADIQCVAVGALHMAAEHGLISQFQNAGYTVKQLN